MLHSNNSNSVKLKSLLMLKQFIKTDGVNIFIFFIRRYLITSCHVNRITDNDSSSTGSSRDISARW